ncbi:Sigma-54 dependent transcriptional regulator [Desulfamplus magnetovallimortis]|uniref:Sigma-54 dependent transcriptional regulator n=2 Tax=Desulfamplus magnetovallimortis TaxID=1246637 RepID=A0A1W1HFX9_9BACT|nr:Sigma-54 dependent transcriptional regulator [Desulfamplus magnetovallimortis]
MIIPQDTSITQRETPFFKEDVALYHDMFDSFKNGIIITDAEGIVFYINSSYCKFLDLDRDKQMGKHCQEVVENSRMHIVAKTGKAEVNHIQDIKGVKTVVQRIPVKRDGKVIAVFGLVMFSDVREVGKLARKIDSLEYKVKLYEEELLNLRATRYTFESILGESEGMRSLKMEALRATANTYPVLITGESGTGKELFAQAIHQGSDRKIYPFVRINCAAIPKDLLESELFGYDKGAFTGARPGGKPGKFELAHRGTIFLDEIGDMPLEMQPKILRVLEEKEFERIGGSKLITSDFRLIAATNRHLEDMMEEGTFRTDLFYRLNVIPLSVPPLRERGSDILLLAEALLKKLSEEADMQGIRISQHARNALASYHWPGNVRELVNVLERTLSRLDGDTIQRSDLPFYIHNRPHKALRDGDAQLNTNGTKQREMDKNRDRNVQGLRSIQMESEKEAVIQALDLCGNNKSKAAKMLGIHRTMLYRKMKKYHLEL